MEGATKEELSELDRLLSVMADMRTPQTDIEGERRGEGDREGEGESGEKERGREGEREREGEGVKERREGEKPTWGTTIAGVSL